MKRRYLRKSISYALIVLCIFQFCFLASEPTTTADTGRWLLFEIGDLALLVLNIHILIKYSNPKHFCEEEE